MVYLDIYSLVRCFQNLLSQVRFLGYRLALRQTSLQGVLPDTFAFRFLSLSLLIPHSPPAPWGVGGVEVAWVSSAPEQGVSYLRLPHVIGLLCSGYFYSVPTFYFSYDHFTFLSSLPQPPGLP